MKMPFGKYRGRDLDDIDHGYLLWVLENVDDLSYFLRAEIEHVLGIGERQEPSYSITTDVAQNWYRRLSMEFHPDRGGTHDGMKAVNRGFELLMELATR